MKMQELLDPTTVARMTALAADVSADQPAHVIQGPGYPITVTKRSTDPLPPRRLTIADALEIDPRSGAMIQTCCVDCKVSLMIDPALPEGVDPETPRVPICDKCAGIRVRYEAIQHQRNVQAIRRTTVAKHQPRTTDGIDHPVTTSKANNNIEENDMDLDNMSDAELGATVRQQMKAAKVETIKAAKPVIEEERRQEAKKDKKAKKKEQKARPQRVLDGFMVGTTLEIPTLDLSDVPSLDEAPSAKERSPYNKARFRLTKEGPLDPEETTYRVLMSEHLRLQGIESERKVEAKPAKTEKPTKKPKVEAIVAKVNPDDDAKVAALASVLGVSKKKARKIMAGL